MTALRPKQKQSAVHARSVAAPRAQTSSSGPSRPGGSTVTRLTDMLASARPGRKLPERAGVAAAGSRMTAEREFSDGEVVPGTRYRVVSLIGSGGMGSVYEVEHVELGKRFVLKALLRGLANRDDLVRRLRNEWRALGKLEHVNIVSVTDAGVTATGVPYFVMERLLGETLATRLRRQRRLRVVDSLTIAADVLDGLHAAHSLGIVHRDVKPPNVFLVANRPAKLLDFGIAKLLDPKASQITGRGIAIGTPRYMSPEQTAGGAVDARSDLYSTGLILYEMIAGAGPFDDAKDGNELFLSQLTREPAPLSKFLPLPSELDRTLSRLLAKKAADRPDDAAKVARTFRAIAATMKNEPVVAAPLPTEDSTLPGGPFDTLEAAATIPSDRVQSKGVRESTPPRRGALEARPDSRSPSSSKAAELGDHTLRLGTLELVAPPGPRTPHGMGGDDDIDGEPTHTAAPRPMPIVETPPPAEPLPSVAVRPATAKSHGRSIALLAAFGACGIAAAVVTTSRREAALGATANPEAATHVAVTAGKAPPAEHPAELGDERVEPATLAAEGPAPGSRDEATTTAKSEERARLGKAAPAPPAPVVPAAGALASPPSAPAHGVASSADRGPSSVPLHAAKGPARGTQTPKKSGAPAPSEVSQKASSAPPRTAAAGPVLPSSGL
jgi:serine/threonine protein kinase